MSIQYVQLEKAIGIHPSTEKQVQTLAVVEFGISENNFNLFFKTAISVVDRCLAL